VIRDVVEKFPGVSLKICPYFSDDYASQQFTKLRSHIYISTDFVFHVDSDCVFKKRFSPEDYFYDSLPILYHREYDFFYRKRIRMPWQSGTSYILRQQVDFEFMALFPLVYPRELYQNLEDWFGENHGILYEDLPSVVNIRSDFSEFNVMGAFSYLHARENPFHCHRNWKDFDPEHYLVQLCQDGGSRDIADDDMIHLSEFL
jgi:hypothetical protein